MDTGDTGEHQPGSEEQKVEVSEGEKKEQTPEVSKAKAKASKATPTTFTEEDVTKKVAEAITAYTGSEDFTKAVQSAKDKSIDKETKPLKDKIRSLEAGKSEKDLAEIEARELKQWGEEGIPKEAIANYHNERRGQVRAAEELLDSLEEHKEELREVKAYKVAKAAGVDLDELLKCATFEEMEQKARDLSHGKHSSEIEKLKDKIKELEGKGEGEENKIDSGKEGAPGKTRSLADRYPTMDQD